MKLKRKKDRVEDALFATKAALDEGIVIGGGHALLYAAGAIDPLGNDDVAIGRRIVKQAISEPFIKIMTNAGHDLNDIRFASFKLVDSGNDLWSGLNYKDLTILDYKKSGITDPKKVTRIALENAASIAGTILTTESVVYEKREDNNNEAPNPMEGMGMM